MINSKRRRREGNIIHQDIHERVFRRGYKLHLATVKETMLSYFFSFIVGSLVLFIAEDGSVILKIYICSRCFNVALLCSFFFKKICSRCFNVELLCSFSFMCESCE